PEPSRPRGARPDPPPGGRSGDRPDQAPPGGRDSPGVRPRAGPYPDRLDRGHHLGTPQPPALNGWGKNARFRHASCTVIVRRDGHGGWGGGGSVGPTPAAFSFPPDAPPPNAAAISARPGRSMLSTT